jgi:hypothetical protein
VAFASFYAGMELARATGTGLVSGVLFTYRPTFSHRSARPSKPSWNPERVKNANHGFIGSRSVVTTSPKSTNALESYLFNRSSASAGVSRAR